MALELELDKKQKELDEKRRVGSMKW